MARSKQFSVEAMRELWQSYKDRCDNRRKPVYAFSPKKLSFAEGFVCSPVSYDIKGFCSFIGISEQAFYKTYAHDEAYAELLDVISLECENSKREGLEQGTIPSALAGLWMAKYGYSKSETVVADVSERTREKPMSLAEMREVALSLLAPNGADDDEPSE